MIYALVEERSGSYESEEIYDSSVLTIQSDAKLMSILGFPIHVSVGVPGTNRNRLMTGVKYVNGKKHMVVQFHCYSSKSNVTGLVTADARKINSKYVIEMVTVDLSDGRQVVCLDSRVQLRKGRFGFT